ncbi:MAG: hypothetical protein FJ291_13415 [Planctomycetes bacterium]|nr:hypothetical protein [Planctomycetota bacterium]
MANTASQQEPSRYWRPVSALVFVVALGLTALTIDDPGLAWDEPFSIGAGASYAAWLAAPSFRAEGIDRRWAPNHEHPPLAKLLMGLSQAAAPNGAEIIASRLVTALLFALLVEMVFQFAGAAFGGLAGLVAALSLLCMPRVFGHAHLATLDIPMSLAWLLAVAAFARAVQRETAGACVVSGVCFGLALLTKINGVFLPLVLAGWGVGFHGRRALRPLAWTLLGGPVVFVLGWPWLWHATLPRLVEYLAPQWRVPIPVMYFGQWWRPAAWHYPLVMTLTTIPVGILSLVILGSVRAVRDFRRQPLLALVAINAAYIIGLFMVPGIPRYDGVRLFLPAFPFLAILAGVAGKRCWEWVAERSKKRPWRPLFAAAAFFLTQAGAVWLIHPCELSYYNALVGGLWGAEKLGMETTYWHEVVNRDLFRWLNRRCQHRQVVAFYPVGEWVITPPFNFYDAYYLNEPKEKELTAVRLEHAPRYDFLVVNARAAMLRSYSARGDKAAALALRCLTHRKPVYAVRRQGVLLAGVYDRE